MYMNPKIIYPIPVRQNLAYVYFRNYSRIVFIVISLICIIINFLTHTKPWSLIVAWCLFSLWRLIFSLKIVEFSIFSHAIRACMHVMVLLVLIDHFLAPGWAQTVIPIFLFAVTLIMMILFYAIYDKKDRHLASILFLGLFVLISIPYSLHSLPITNWIAFSFNVASVVLLIILIIINYKDVIYEVKARLNLKK